MEQGHTVSVCCQKPTPGLQAAPEEDHVHCVTGGLVICFSLPGTYNPCTLQRGTDLWDMTPLIGSVGQWPCCCHLPGKGDHIPARAFLYCCSLSLLSPAVRLHSMGPGKSRGFRDRDRAPSHVLPWPSFGFPGGLG